MENTSDKSFISHNSDKPFIRTMEDDLKKIKNSPTGKAGINSAVFSLASKPSQPSVFQDEAKHSNAAPSRVATPAPAPSIPKNLPVDLPIAEKAEDTPPKSIFKSIEKPKPKSAPVSNMQNSRIIGKINSIGSGLDVEKKSDLGGSLSKLAFDPTQRQNQGKPSEFSAAGQKEKNIPVFKPIAPVSGGAFSGKSQGRRGRLAEDTENLPPEARLARQLSLGANDSEYKESLIMPPPIRASRPIPEQSSKIIEPFNSASLPSSSLENRKRSIEEIIKEDNSKNSFFGKFIKVLIAVLAVAGIVAGAYYFYNKNNPAAVPASVESFIFGAKDADITINTNASLNNEVRKYFSDIRLSGIYRLILKDKDGKDSLSLESFGKSSNIILPDYVANVLEKDYNLIAFNYPEKNYLRLGLVLKPKKLIDISEATRDWEPYMYGNIGALFMGDFGAYDPQKQFGGNKYNNFDIRYLSLGSENAALNYAIDNKKNFLLIATSKQDIFSLIDNIIKENK